MADFATPEWVKHAVFYHIFPDRFAKSDRVSKPSNVEPWDSEPTEHGYKGGDLLGVVERLDYLQDLGITALYFNPIFQSASNHGYHTHDYMQVDPLLGGDSAFRTMLAECQGRDIRVVLDGVFNHCGRGFYQFNDVLENGASSPWLDWFHFDNHPANAYEHSRPPGYRAWYNLHALPVFNTDNPMVREYLMRIAEHWVEEGIDGWRLDVPNEIKSEGFWEEFRERIKRVNPEAYIVGELWGESRAWLQGDRFDAVMNYVFTDSVISFVSGERTRPELVSGMGYKPWPPRSGVEYADRIDWLLEMYPREVTLAQLNLLGSHDTARILTIAGGDEASVRLAVLLLFTFPGAPSIYYGDEIGLTGGRPDRLARKSFPWDHPESWNTSLLELHRELISLRKREPALRTGDYTRLLATEDVYVLARTLSGRGLIVAVNVAESPRQVQVPLDGLTIATGEPVVIFGSAEVRQTAPSALSLDLPPREGVVVVVSLNRAG